ncbi:DUF4328 domain-containing protein [Streptomyces kurssanovii]|uniref:DUF4328 domain-containing protein n=1 Tax=Streptomyces kurssanovii TaxID=67312 RepID=A0ABV3HQ14_9ACTN
MLLCSDCRRQTAPTEDGRCADCLFTKAAAGTAAVPSSLTPAPVPAAALPRSPLGLGRAVMVLLGLVVLTDIASIGALLNMRALFADTEFKPFATYTVEEGEQADQLIYCTTSFQMMAFLVTAVVFIIWFHRVTKNAALLAPDVLTRGTGWAIGAWFIPIANLWIPRSIAAQVWTASRSLPHAGDEHQPRTPVNLWWAAYLGSWLVMKVAERRYVAAEAPLDVVSATELLVAAEALDIIAAALAVRFVHRLTAMQCAAAASRPNAPLAPATVPDKERRGGGHR